MTLLRHDVRKLKELAARAGKAGGKLAKHIEHAERDPGFAEELSRVWDLIENGAERRVDKKKSELSVAALAEAEAAADARLNNWLDWNIHDEDDPTLRADAFAALEAGLEDKLRIFERIMRSARS